MRRSIVGRICGVLGTMGLLAVGSTSAKAALTITLDLFTTPPPLEMTADTYQGSPTAADVLEAVTAYNLNNEPHWSTDVGWSFYKAEPDEEGPLAGLYSTSVSLDGTWTIEFTGETGAAPGGFSYLVVKDGAAGSYLFNLGLIGWNAEDTLRIPDLWGTGDSISHVEFFGVPEPTTMIAGGLLLLPFLVSTIRIVRSGKQ